MLQVIIFCIHQDIPANEITFLKFIFAHKKSGGRDLRFTIWQLFPEVAYTNRLANHVDAHVRP